MIKIGVVGCRRGRTMMRYCIKSKDAVLTAICDYNREAMEKEKKSYGKKGKAVRLFTDFDTFLAEADIDAVVLANYGNDHAPYAIKCLNAGKHVLSELLPVETLKEAVELCECIEKTGLVYAYAENCCYFPAVREMQRLYKAGALGEFEYGEGEYIHDCEPRWKELTGSNKPDHWRNVMSAFYYCTHSAGPLVHLTGMRPVKVSGTEGRYNSRMQNIGAGGAAVAVETVTMENGGVFKSTHGLGLPGNSTWFSVYGETGHAESKREYSGFSFIPHSRYVQVGLHTTPQKIFPKKRIYCAPVDRRSKIFGHNGSDWYIMHNFIERINGREADVIDVYEALDMYFIGHFGFLSALSGGAALDIPDFRDKSVREKYREDTSCPDPKKAGEMLLPSNTHGKVKK